MCVDRNWTGLTSDSFINKTGYNEVKNVIIKVMGDKNEGQVFKKLGEEHDFSLCQLA